jgi:hypothetical protein
MGYAISWLAVRGSAESSVLSSLGLENTGETEEISESDWCSAQLGDWILVWSNSYEPARFRHAPSKLKGEVLMCDVEEHVMFVSVSAFNHGIQSWRIVHDAQLSRDHLIVEGNPPESFGRIRDEELARVESDREVDFIFEIPVRMAQELVGFRHDAGEEPEFSVLRSIAPVQKSSSGWKFWKK